MPRHPGRTHRNDQGGFALLEAIVALAILAAAGLALFAALSQALQMVGRADRARERAQVQLNVLALVDTIDPMANKSGNMQFGEYDLQWQSHLLEPVQDGATGTLARGFYEIALYRIDCKVRRGREEIGEFSVRKTGYRQVREPDPFL